MGCATGTLGLLTRPCYAAFCNSIQRRHYITAYQPRSQGKKSDASEPRCQGKNLGTRLTASQITDTLRWSITIVNIPWHRWPLLVYPGLQLHWKEPCVLVHTWSHPPLFTAHSSKSMKRKKTTFKLKKISHLNLNWRSLFLSNVCNIVHILGYDR